MPYKGNLNHFKIPFNVKIFSPEKNRKLQSQLPKGKTNSNPPKKKKKLNLQVLNYNFNLRIHSGRKILVSFFNFFFQIKTQETQGHCLA